MLQVVFWSIVHISDAAPFSLTQEQHHSVEVPMFCGSHGSHGISKKDPMNWYILRPAVPPWFQRICGDRCARHEVPPICLSSKISNISLSESSNKKGQTINLGEISIIPTPWIMSILEGDSLAPHHKGWLSGSLVAMKFAHRWLLGNSSKLPYICLVCSPP